MNENDYAAYKSEATPTDAPVVIHVGEVPGDDRTLVYGYSRTYDAEHNESTHTVHAYKRDGALHVVFYDHNGERVYAVSGASVAVEDFIPHKRAYPERCDVGFARLLRERGYPLNFTTFGAVGAFALGLFAGRLIEDTTVSAAKVR